MNDPKNEIKRRLQPTYRTLLRSAEVLDEMQVVAGDFNNNATWDDMYYGQRFKMGKFRDTTHFLKGMGFVSAYHEQQQEAFGEESKPTHIWKQDVAMPHHIDYCFVRHENVRKYSYQLLEDPAWVQNSDHFPFYLDLPIEA